MHEVLTPCPHGGFMYLWPTVCIRGCAMTITVKAPWFFFVWYATMEHHHLQQANQLHIYVFHCKVRFSQSFQTWLRENLLEHLTFWSIKNPTFPVDFPLNQPIFCVFSKEIVGCTTDTSRWRLRSSIPHWDGVPAASAYEPCQRGGYKTIPQRPRASALEMGDRLQGYPL